MPVGGKYLHSASISYSRVERKKQKTNSPDEIYWVYVILIRWSVSSLPRAVMYADTTRVVIIDLVHRKAVTGTRWGKEKGYQYMSYGLRAKKDALEAWGNREGKRQLERMFSSYIKARWIKVSFSFSGMFFTVIHKLISRYLLFLHFNQLCHQLSRKMK